MRILVVSHNVFSKTESMGKTLESYFKDFDVNDLAQFYIHSEIPTSNVCHNYYRITDKEIVKSILGIVPGTIFKQKDIELDRKTSRTDSGIDAHIYQKARKRTPMIYIARNLCWKLGHWNTKKFQKWLDDYNPECIFLASGDYAFIYDIALKIAKDRNIPLYISCVDDFYFNNRNEKNLIGRIQYKFFMKSVCNAINYASKIFCICDAMSIDYGKFFKKTCVTLHTGASFEHRLFEKKKRKISYIGNLGYDRYLQLIDIGRTLKSLEVDIDHIDVYSGECRDEILKHMTPENGIVFHGQISSESVKKVMGESLAVIHTESFDEKIKKAVKYSVSTKIADSLMSGTCIFAYGPSDIASIQYLSKNDAAICAYQKIELAQKLYDLINDVDYRESIIKNAIELGQKNHFPDIAGSVIKNNLQ